MDKRKNTARIFLIFIIILFFCLLCLLIGLRYFLKNGENNSNIGIAISESSEPKTIEEVIKKYDSEFIKQENNSIYVKFSKDLYDENGKSNESFFENLTKELEPFFENSDFEIIDEDKKIEISAEYDIEKEQYEIKINDIEDFYNKTNGDSYVAVEKSEIIEPSKIMIDNGFLELLRIKNMYLSSIEEYLDDEKILDNGYVSYKSDKLRLKISPNKSVMNIIFTENYNGSILIDVDRGEDLTKVYEKHSDNTFGSLSDGYLGYRNGDFYYFFYKDEVSIYGYSYSKNEVFEELLEKYLEDKDLGSFVNTLADRTLSYDTFEYDEEIKKATLIFPTRGIEIKIEDNDPKGITLYSNYYFTDTTKKMVKNGLISYSTEDLVAKYETQRRESK